MNFFPINNKKRLTSGVLSQRGGLESIISSKKEVRNSLQSELKAALKVHQRRSAHLVGRRNIKKSTEIINQNNV
jgi:hypothetical protein